MPLDISKLSNSTASNRQGLSETRESSETARTSAVSPESGTSLSGGGFSKGQTFSGQITNITPKEVTISLPNGESMTAKYDNLSELSIGDGARFKVMERSESRLTIKPVSNGNTLENVVYKALDASGLPFSAKNEELVTALLKNEFPVNRQMMNTILQQSLKNPDISMTNLVLMNKSGLPIEPEMTRMFENYSNLRNELTVSIKDSFSDMLSMIDGLISDGNIDKAGALASGFLDTLNIGLEPDELVLTLINNDEASVTTEVMPTLSEFGEALEIFLTEREGSENINNTASDSKITESAPLSDIWSEEQRLEIFSVFENSDADAEAIQKLLNGQLTLSELSELVKTLPENELHKQEKLPDTFSKLITDLNLNTGTDINPLTGLLPESATLSDASEQLKELLNSPDINASVKSALLKSGDFRKTLEMLLNTDWTLSASELSGKDAVNKLYNRINSQLEKLSELAKGNDPLSAKLSTDLGQMKQNMNFMNTLSQMYNYVEIPLRMSGQTVSGELYVYSNKHRKKNAGDSSISCLLHLDMENLGAMNVRIELKENTVSTKFYLNDDISGKLISEHLHELDAAVSKQGFNINSEVVKTGDKNKKENENTNTSGNYNLVNDFIASEVSGNRYTRYTFDVRA